MPKARPTIVSFWVLRPEEHPEAETRNYPGMLRILQRSCDRLGLRHLVLTDERTASDARWPDVCEPWISPLPEPLMQAVTQAQASYLESKPDVDTIFVGADCIFIDDPIRYYPPKPAVCVTYRNPAARYPINTGAIMVRHHSLDKATALFRRVRDRAGTTWCDDQRALIAELSPMPLVFGVYKRAGIDVAFLPMAKFNVVPRSVEDTCRGSLMLHFRGKARKQFFFDWADRHGYA